LPEGEELYTGWDYDMDMEYPVYDINYKEGLFVGYRWYEFKNIQPLYAFGHGLSYSTFEYTNLNTDAESYKIEDEVMVKVDVKNSGDVHGKEVVQLYVRDMDASVERPLKELKGFRKVELKAGGTKTVFITLKQRDFAFWDEESSDWKVESGKFEILIGSASSDIRLKKEIEID
jgi:beta-glucosidase